MDSKRILAFSSSRSGQGSYLEKVAPVLQDFLGDKKLKIAFIPFASVERSYGEYLDAVKAGLAALPHSIGLAEPANAKKLITEADVVMVGGGNTFKLLHDIHHYQLLDVIRYKVDHGIPYVGWSAGSNITSPSIATTNDMPIIWPKTSDALGILPFQVNPHYTNLKLEGHNGETRDARLMEFIKLNPGIPVLGLPEGTGLKLDKGRLTYFGNVPAILFANKAGEPNEKRPITVDEDLSYLL